MTSDPNDKLHFSRMGRRKSSNPSEEGNLEFNFGSQPSSSPMNESKTSSKQDTENLTRKVEPSNISSEGSAQRTSFRPKSYTDPNDQNDDRTHRQKGADSPTPARSMTNPTFSQFQQNIQRQSREQKVVGSFLSGVAITLASLILLVAGLAGYGVYILSQQIQDQSATVRDLDRKTTASFRRLQSDLGETRSVLDDVNTQTHAQKQEIGWLKSQLEEVRKQARSDRVATDAKLKRLGDRVYDLERLEAERR